MRGVFCDLCPDGSMLVVFMLSNNLVALFVCNAALASKGLWFFYIYRNPSSVALSERL